MSIDLKSYQETAVGELIKNVSALIEREGRGEVCVFQAPTGSGKTIVTAKFIERLIKELAEVDLCFLWITIGKGNLHLQSKHSLEKIFQGSPRVSLVEEEFHGGRERIVRNEVVVVNWEKLRSKDRSSEEWKNILMKDGEKINFRDVLAKTREQCQIIMIIDESHIGATAERTQELRDEINADVVVEMSATPKLKPSAEEITKGSAGYVLVEPKDVIEEGMIKKEIIINKGIDKLAKNEKDSQEVILESAYQMRLELKRAFEQIGSNVNPLVLIQIPIAEAGETKMEAVQKFLDKKGVTTKNGKLAIWLAEQKSETVDWIRDPDNEIEFLIFKQAIDTGWDCPRAHILVKFRETKNLIFEIQTVGRILRMPERYHYNNEILNTGYVFTNVQSVIVRKEEYNPNIIKHLKANLTTDYKPIQLTSYYKSRADYGDITSSFAPVFVRIANKYFGLENKAINYNPNIKKLIKKGLSLDLKKHEQDIIADTKLDGKSFDELEGKIAPEDLVRLTIAGDDLLAMFEQLIKDNLGSFRGVKRSIPPVKTAIYIWFRGYLGSSKWPEEALLIQKIFLYAKNRSHFEKILAKAIDEYKSIREAEVRKKVEASEQYYDYKLPSSLFFNEHTDEVIKSKSYAYDPCYLSVGRLAPERNFEQFLNDYSDKIVWWWKNGEDKQDYFGVRYEYQGGIFTFYPDYLVQFKDGRIGIFEVKDTSDRDGTTKTKAKAEALQTWLIQQKRKELFGGIMIERNRAWLINNQKQYNWDKYQKGDWNDWVDLATIL